MVGSSIKDNDRSAILTRFIILYIVSILCGIIPLYYLFAIPDVAISELKASKLSTKGQQEQIDRFKELFSELDQFKEKKQFLNEYKNLNFKLYNFAKDSVDKTNLYKPVFIKVSDLYEYIQKMNEQGADKESIEKLKTELETIKNAKEAVDQQLKDCAIEKGVLQGLLSKK